MLMTYPVCFMWREKQIKVTEVVVTVITNSMIHTGSGFWVCQPGISTLSNMSMGSNDQE